MNAPAPDEFKKVCRNLVQGLDLIASTPEQLVQVALLGVDSQERLVIKVFIDQLLDGRYSEEQLKEFWWSMPADIVFREGQGVVTLLTILRDELAKTA